MKTRITKSVDERRQEILEAAIKVFSKKGYEKTSISDIAKEINVAQGLCYRYFSSKEELFDVALEQYSDLIVEKFSNSLEGKENWSLRDILSEMPSFTDVEQSNSNFYQLWHLGNSKKIHVMLSEEVSRKLVPIVSDLLKKYNEIGEINIDDADTAASFFVYGQIGVLNNDKITAAEKKEKVVRFLVEMLKLK